MASLVPRRPGRIRTRLVIAVGVLGLVAAPSHSHGAAADPAPIESQATAPTVAGCAVFPADNPWNTDISGYPTHPNSGAFIASISRDANSHLHPDFGGNGEYGIPFKVVSSVPKRRINYTLYGDESDPGPFPIPPSTPIEGGSNSTGDRHVIVIRKDTCRLFELYRAFWRGDHWDAGSGARWDLSSNALRPLGWTSADAAGLPIFPGLVRYDELATGHIDHALRFTVSRTQRGYVLPATHFASSSNDRNLPPMGLRLRLKASFGLGRYHGHAKVILVALKKYGMIVADNGSSWFIQGASDTRFNDDNLSQLKRVPGSAFEVVTTGPIHRP